VQCYVSSCYCYILFCLSKILFIGESITCSNMSFIICMLLFTHILPQCISCNIQSMQHLTCISCNMSLAFFHFVFYVTHQTCNMPLVICLFFVTCILSLYIYASASINVILYKSQSPNYSSITDYANVNVKVSVILSISQSPNQIVIIYKPNINVILSKSQSSN
jgi:hypothetical protein